MHQAADLDIAAVAVPKKPWQEIATSMQKHRDATIACISPAIPDIPSSLPLNVSQIPKTLLSVEEIHITESAPEKLLGLLADGEVSAESVTIAFLRRAGLAQKLTNCITELLPERALQRARELDEYLSKHGKPMGVLHGLPISVKEHIGMKGLNHNAGFISWCDRTASEDAFILSLLWEAGAVFFARTTQPQTLMHLETSSGIYGTTINPFNRNLTCGGSSGGEGALIGIRGSCLGIGTDIGGSIRSPAANNAVFGLKPTSCRLPLSGFAATMLGAEHIVPTAGPLSTSLAGLNIFMKAIIDQKPWLRDPSLLPFPWQTTTQPHSLLDTCSKTGRRKLRIGIMTDDGVVKPHPPILRAMETLTSSLTNVVSSDIDVSMVDFPVFNHAEAWRIISSLYFADGGAEETMAITSSGEPFRPLSNFILHETGNVRELSVPELWDLVSQREGFRKAYAHHWNTVRGPDGEVIDVLLCPVGPGAAPPLNSARYWGYTSLFNLLDYPAVVFPTGLSCEPERDVRDEGYSPRNKDDEFNHKLCELRIARGKGRKQGTDEKLQMIRKSIAMLLFLFNWSVDDIKMRNFSRLCKLSWKLQAYLWPKTFTPLS